MTDLIEDYSRCESDKVIKPCQKIEPESVGSDGVHHERRDDGGNNPQDEQFT